MGVDVGGRVLASLATVVATASVGFAANSAPVISSFPTLNSSALVADDTTEYTVVMTVSDVDGYNDIRDARVLFDFVRAGGDHARGRGYLAWGQADADITRFGGTWVTADAAGGGRWAYNAGDWGGDTYMTPVSCSLVVGGAATGASGSRTVTWTFKVKPTWAHNPTINTADAFAGDYAVNVGWREGAAEFDVVPAACTSWSAAPSAPVVSSPTASGLGVAIHPADSDGDLFAIRIWPPVRKLQFVQTDGSIGGFPAWRTKADWGTVAVGGLVSSTAYTFSVRAMTGVAGNCPSAWGPTAGGTTAILARTVDCSSPGVTFNKGIMGMDAQPKVLSAQRIADNLAASFNTSMRYGGDGYNFKTRTAQWTSSTRSTLQALRDARDRNSYVQICLNTRGIGTGNGSTWVYTDQTAATLAGLAADWVYYCNKLVSNKRQGDALATQEQAILDSLNWGSDDKLLAPGEPPVPPVVYWEIGNEPEGPYPPPALAPDDYAARYSTITQAMRAVDPTIKVGPGVMSADNGNAWLDAVFSNAGNRVDFVAYHPYGPLYWITKNNSGGVLNANDLMGGLDSLKQQQTDRRQKVVDRLTANNRPGGTPLVASEFNPVSWEGTYYYNLSQTVAQGLGLAETIFTFAELGFTAAQYWDLPNYPSTTPREVPGFKVFKMMQAEQPERVIHSCVDGTFRLYATLADSETRLVVWAINVSETDDKPVEIHVAGPVRATAVTEYRLADTRGDTSLVTRNDRNDPRDYVDWIVVDRTGQIDPAGFTWTFEDATLTMLVFHLRHLARVDYDQDDDVDQTDYGHLQACLGGGTIPPLPGCSDADLDEDQDVDQNDLALFLGCMSGPGSPAGEYCPD
ncbi:MAG: hypothetical protein HY718_11340 [Planctomycetes bacterium]|nr:hypothetical protein [Planctomycetota bacterium]